MKAEDFKGKTPDELQKMLLESRKEQMNLRFQKNGGQLENTAQIRKIRRKIARIKTFLQTPDMTKKAAPKTAPAKAKAKPAKKSSTKAA